MGAITILPSGTECTPIGVAHGMGIHPRDFTDAAGVLSRMAVPVRELTIKPEAYASKEDV
jgi:hypothetical protein